MFLFFFACFFVSIDVSENVDHLSPNIFGEKTNKKVQTIRPRDGHVKHVCNISVVVFNFSAVFRWWGMRIPKNNTPQKFVKPITICYDAREPSRWGQQLAEEELSQVALGEASRAGGWTCCYARKNALRGTSQS